MLKGPKGQTGQASAVRCDLRRNIEDMPHQLTVGFRHKIEVFYHMVLSA
ncbi:TPA: hypothetical protein TXJ16_000289 [Streptococcus suis]|nr:hypothetical protein [Streptococcus suis]